MEKRDVRIRRCRWTLFGRSGRKRNGTRSFLRCRKKEPTTLHSTPLHLDSTRIRLDLDSTRWVAWNGEEWNEGPRGEESEVVPADGRTTRVISCVRGSRFDSLEASGRSEFATACMNKALPWQRRNNSIARYVRHMRNIWHFSRERERPERPDPKTNFWNRVRPPVMLLRGDTRRDPGEFVLSPPLLFYRTREIISRLFFHLTVN